MFKNGDRVFHQWSYADFRPKQINEKTITRLGFNEPGVILGLETTHDFTGGKLPYWRVKINDVIVQWRQDLIKYAN